MSKKGPTHIGENIRSFLENDLKLPNFGAELKIWEFWEKAVGAEVARQTAPKSFKNGILFVEARHPIWATELQFRRQQIKEKLNQLLGQELVKEIHFRAGA